MIIMYDEDGYSNSTNKSKMISSFYNGSNSKRSALIAGARANQSLRHLLKLASFFYYIPANASIDIAIILT
jgi:hypothetical protein